MSAAQVANVDEFARKLPLKYKTEVGERGVKLSGGECQRIAIARAILKDPRILILDEATSEVDSKAEKLIQQALNRLMQGRTTFIIAHRLFTALNSDRIFALENGKIIGEGKHEILYKTLPLYKKLCEEQLVKEKIDEGC
jgi:ATP-binding cassette subfamily B protein AbcA/BmrA